MANGIKLDELTISQVHEAYKNGDYTCSELVQAYLDRIEAIDKNGPTLGAVLAISKTALEEGDALDKHFKSTSAFVGPLHGIPVLLKDQAETKGLATTYGSIVARNSNNVPMEDSTVVQKLKAGGAVILGKTTMPGKSSWKCRYPAV
jgi:amidase